MKKILLAAMLGWMCFGVMMAGGQTSSPDTDGKDPKVDAFLKAVQTNDAATCRRMLDEGMNPKGLTPDQTPWVTEAAFFGQVEVVSILVQAGADINGRNPEGDGPLTSAIYNRKPAMAQWLLDQGADIDQANARGQTPLMLACKFPGNQEVARELIKRGANLEVRDQWQQNALAYAIMGGQKDLAIALLKMGIDFEEPNFEGWTPFLLACSYNQVEIAKALAEMGCELKVQSEDEWTPRRLATRNGSIEMLKFLESKGLPPNLTDKYNHMHTACRFAQVKVLQYFQEKGGDLKMPGLMEAAAQSRSMETLRFLFEAGARPRKTEDDGSLNDLPLYLKMVKDGWSEGAVAVYQGGRNPEDEHAKDWVWHDQFLAAVLGDHTEEVRRMLAERGEVPQDVMNLALDIALAEGRILSLTALREYYLVDKPESPAKIARDRREELGKELKIAIDRNQLQEVEQLLREGADVNYLPPSISEDVSTPLGFAIECDRLEILDLLIGSGADVNKWYGDNLFRKNHLQEALRDRNISFARKLREAGAVMRIEGNEDDLGVMVDWGRKEHVRFLLEIGFNPDVHMHNGRLPLAIAAGKGDVEMIRLLLELKANVNARDDDGFYALDLARARGQEEAAKLLMEAGSGWSPNSPEFFEIAWDGCHLNVVEWMIKNNISLEEPPKNQYDTPLAMTLRTRSNTAWVNAAGWPEAAVLMLENNVGIDEHNKQRGDPSEARTILGLAVEGKETEPWLKAIRLILDRGVDVNERFAEQEMTALMLAAKKHHYQAAKLLLERGADPSLKNKYGLTAFDLANLAGADPENAIFKVVAQKAGEGDKSDSATSAKTKGEK